MGIFLLLICQYSPVLLSGGRQQGGLFDSHGARCRRTIGAVHAVKVEHGSLACFKTTPIIIGKMGMDSSICQDPLAL